MATSGLFGLPIERLTSDGAAVAAGAVLCQMNFMYAAIYDKTQLSISTSMRCAFYGSHALMPQRFYAFLGI